MIEVVIKVSKESIMKAIMIADAEGEELKHVLPAIFMASIDTIFTSMVNSGEIE